MARTARYARCEAPKRSWTLSKTAVNGHSQRDKETGEPDDATSILSGSAGGWEKRPKGPRSQPTQLPRDTAAIAVLDSPGSCAFNNGICEAQCSALGVRQQYPVVINRHLIPNLINSCALCYSPPLS